MEKLSTKIPKSLLGEIRRRANVLDQSGQWPQQELDELAKIGGWRWAVPKQWGGDGLSALEQHLIYERLARSSLAVALILSQRDAAVGFIEASQSSIREEILPRLATGEWFTTVGIAQLTTSRQNSAPALKATRTSGGYELNGVVPWSSGAAKAQWLVVGAFTEEDQRILALLPADSPGVKIGDPMPLVAMRSTWTASLQLDGVKIEDRQILQGPAPKVLIRKNDVPLRQAFLPLGFCRGAMELIAEHWSSSSENAFKRFEAQLEELRSEVLRLSEPGMESQANDAAPLIRAKCGDLALRASHAAVTLYKGSALLSNHPAQRLAREALFLLVWSCPNPVIDSTVDLLTGEFAVR